MFERTGGTIDAVRCNAGYSILGAFEDYSDVQCRQQMETNFFGTLAVARAVLPAMREAQRGKPGQASVGMVTPYERKAAR